MPARREKQRMYWQRTLLVMNALLSTRMAPVGLQSIRIVLPVRVLTCKKPTLPSAPCTCALIAARCYRLGKKNGQINKRDLCFELLRGTNDNGAPQESPMSFCHSAGSRRPFWFLSVPGTSG